MPRKPRSVICYETGEEFSSCVDAAEHIGVKSSDSIRHAIKSKGTAGGYHWYYADEPKPYPGELKGRGRAVVCFETGEVFESISAAARSIGTDASYLKCKIETKKAYKGYHWRYASADEAAKPPLQNLQTPTPETPENACHDKLNEAEQQFFQTLTEKLEAHAAAEAEKERLGFPGSNWELYFGTPRKAAESVSRLVDMYEEAMKGNHDFNSPFTDNFRYGGSCEYGLCHQNTLKLWLESEAVDQTYTNAKLKEDE